MEVTQNLFGHAHNNSLKLYHNRMDGVGFYIIGQQCICTFIYIVVYRLAKLSTHRTIHLLNRRHEAVGRRRTWMGDR